MQLSQTAGGYCMIFFMNKGEIHQEKEKNNIIIEPFDLLSGKLITMMPANLE